MFGNLRPWQPEPVSASVSQKAADDQRWPVKAGPWKRFVNVLLGHRSPRRTFQRSLLPADAIAAIEHFGGTIVYNEA